MTPSLHRDLFWDRCRNSLGIARLLAHEGRPLPLVDTATQMAVESACRAALAHLGQRFDGDLEAALRQLAIPDGLWAGPQPGEAAGLSRLAAAERVVARVSAYLRDLAPERSWGY